MVRRSAPMKLPLPAIWLGWNEPPFVIPEAISAKRGIRRRSGAGRRTASGTIDLKLAMPGSHPELAAEFNRRINGNLPANWEFFCRSRDCCKSTAAGESVATRKASLIEYFECIRTGLARTAGRLGRPDRLESDETLGLEL